MSLPDDKLMKLRHELSFFKARTRATVKQLRRLCGILAYASRIVHGGRTFSRRVIDLLKGIRIRLSTQFRWDIEWWEKWALKFNGQATMIRHNYGLGQAINSDASLSGYGLISNKWWIAGYYNSQLIPQIFQISPHLGRHWINLQVGQECTTNINVLELVPIWLACLLWGHTWKNQQIVCWNDNTQVVASVNKGISANKISMCLLRDIFWQSVHYNFHLVARHIPGILNSGPDFLSRICDTTTTCDLMKHVSCNCRGPRAIG